MSIILAIETTIGGCSVALSTGQSCYIDQPNQQTSKLAGMVETVINEANLSFEQINAYATTIGPGSFTGVRIGLAFVRGLAIAKPKPIYSINTLELFAYQAIEAGAKGSIVSAINAHRNQVYIQKFSINNELPDSTSQPEAIELENIPTGDFTLTGNAETFFNKHKSISKTPDAAALARYCTKLPTPNIKEKPSPIYLRAPDAKAQKGDLSIAQ